VYRAEASGRPLICARCGLPLLRGQALEAGHTVPLVVDRASVADCIEHAACNPRGPQRSGA
jgi:hypothetical protein